MQLNVVIEMFCAEILKCSVTDERNGMGIKRHIFVKLIQSMLICIFDADSSFRE